MSLFRIIVLVLVGLLFGFPVVSAQSGPLTPQVEGVEANGDGNPENDDERAREGMRPDGEGQTGSADKVTTEDPWVHTFSLDQDEHGGKKIHLLLPFETGNAYAVMVAGEQGVKIPLLVVANHLEVDLDVFKKLNELSVREARIWLANANVVLFIDVAIDGDANTVTFTLTGGDGGVVILPG